MAHNGYKKWEIGVAYYVFDAVLLSTKDVNIPSLPYNYTSIISSLQLCVRERECPVMKCYRQKTMTNYCHASVSKTCNL